MFTLISLKTKLVYVLNTTCITGIVILFVSSSFAQAKSSFNSLQNSAAVGITHQFSGKNLSILIDQQKMLRTIPKLQKAKVINPNLSKTEIDFYQSLFPATVSILYVSALVKNTYLTHSDIDQIHVDAYLLTVDLYGNNEKSLCYSFDFDRSLYQKINWKKFQADNLKHIALNFKTSNVCQNLMDINPDSI